MSAGSITKFITPSLKAAINGRSSKISTELLKSSTALLSSAPEGGKHTLPSLSYDYGALERKYLVVSFKYDYINDKHILCVSNIFLTFFRRLNPFNNMIPTHLPTK